MSEALSTEDLVALVRRVFRPGSEDRRLAVLCDLPDSRVPDHPDWGARRAMAADWTRRLDEARRDIGLDEVCLVLYRNVRRNNADLPERVWIHRGGSLPASAEEAGAGEVPLEEVLSSNRIVLAPTELSATAPLKLLARRHGFRAATMPGFGPAMIPALRLDWEEIDARCRGLKQLLDEAESARLRFEVEGRRHDLVLDLRHRTATASGGLLTEPGIAGNLPSGESYIVPYEGEREGDPSGSRGELPVQLEGEVVLYRIEENRAVDVLGDGPVAGAERKELAVEPAYGNLAELGLGILRGYGIQPVGSILLDEKLGLHIAFGRSDHFGGRVGAADFSSPEKVVHIDRVYIPEVQPRIVVSSVDLASAGGALRPLIRAGAYV